RQCRSRAAALALCVEKSNGHVEVLRQNVAQVGLDAARLEVRVQDAFAALAQLAAAGQQFDLIFADPPYGEKNVGRRSTSFAQQLLDNSNLPALLATGGLFVLGHARRDTLDLPDTWKEAKV